MPKPETKPRARTKTDPAVSRAFAIEAARLLADDKCEDVVVLDVRGVSHVTDFIVIGTGTSERQMRSTLSNLDDIGALAVPTPSLDDLNATIGAHFAFLRNLDTDEQQLAAAREQDRPIALRLLTELPGSRLSELGIY